MIKAYTVLFLTLIITGCKSSPAIYPQRKDIIETVYASGKIMADSEYTAYALNAGTVIRKMVKEGDILNSKQLLYVIRNVAPAARVDAANSALMNAQQNLSANSRILNDLKISMQNTDLKFTNDSLQYSRYRNLWNQNIGTKINLDNAETEYRISFNQKKSAREKYASTVNDLRVSLKNAKSQAVNAQSDLDNYFIRAQSSGTVYQMMKENGEAVKANEAVALIGKSSKRIIRLSVDQQDINKIKEGQEVLLKTDVTGEQIFRAKVQRTYPVMNEADQTFRVDAIFVLAASQRFIHSSVEANIIIQHKYNCLTIPSAVLVNGDSVKIKQRGHTHTIAVKTGIHTINEVEILAGINEHTEILTPSQK